VSADWGSDVPVSMPQPLEDVGLVPMFGFVFTINGLRHDISEADHERLSRSGYTPISPANTDWGDVDV
jgi:hypothetical protein